MKLSIVIPAYNEEKRIGFLLNDYLKFIHENGLKWELIVVVNNSIDRTEDIVKNVQTRYHSKVKLLVFQYPIGKGGALIEGLSAADGDFLAYIDADDSVVPNELYKLYRVVIEKRRAIVLGSRWLSSSIVDPPLPVGRVLASRVYNFLVNILFGLGLKDTQCAAKILHRRLFENIKSQLFIADMSFDVNLLYIARRLGYELIELPILWYNQSGSKVRVLKTGILMFLSLVRLRLFYSPFRNLVPIGEKLFAPLRKRWSGMYSSDYFRVKKTELEKAS